MFWYKKHLGWNWLESVFFHTLIFSEARHGAYLHPGLWTRYGGFPFNHCISFSIAKKQNQEVLTSNTFHTDSKGFMSFPSFWFQWFLMIAFLIVLSRRVWHVQCFCRCAIRSKSGNSVWVENTDYSHTALKWAATTQQFRPFRQSCEANLPHFSLPTGSHDIEEIFGTQNWLVMETQCGFAFMLESLGKSPETSRINEPKGRLVGGTLSPCFLYALSMPIWCCDVGWTQWGWWSDLG